MKLKDIMTKEVEVASPDNSLREAAQKMRVRDIGFLPVVDDGRLLGVITDRDIVVRGVAEGNDADTKIGQKFVTTPAVFCYDDQEVEEAAKLMEDHQIRRMLVMGRDDDRVAGVVSLGDIATRGKEKTSAKVLQSVSEPTT
jgi:CBS domain-containing protein